MKLLETEHLIRSELQERHKRGECVTIQDVDAISLADDDGFYVRFRVTLADGTSFDVDTDEPIRLTRRH